VRRKQYDLTLDSAFNKLLSGNRAFELVKLFTPPEFLVNAGGLPFDFDSKWDTFVAEVRSATTLNVCKQEAILAANQAASGTVLGSGVRMLFMCMEMIILNTTTKRKFKVKVCMIQVKLIMANFVIKI